MRRERLLRTTVIVTAFAMVMGFLEAVIVIYLRKLYYPHGFHFPLVLIPGKVVIIEYTREAASLVMLIMIGLLAGKNSTGQFGWFLISFGIWDISYYLALKLVLGWPEGWLTWDVLFLIPVIWTGPVLAPVICSFTMILYGFVLNTFQHTGRRIRLKSREWFFLLAGSLVIFITFIRDYSSLLLKYLYQAGQGYPWEEDFMRALTRYVPDHFYWIPFSAGELLIVISLFLIIARVKRK